MRKYILMKNEIVLFTTDQGSLLIRLLLAHFISDFILQSSNIVNNKKWLTKQMLIHVAIVFVSTLVLSKMLLISATIALSHWLIDSIKMHLLEKKKSWESRLFFIDQGIHIFILLVIWTIHFNIFPKVFSAIELPFFNYKISLLLLAYIFIMYPTGYIIKHSIAKIAPRITNVHLQEEDESIEILNGGKLIGQFERLIILTFVLLNQYEAIGFLITGKSIIRFAERDGKLRSEYVLVGTLMSFAIAIITGVVIKKLLFL